MASLLIADIVDILLEGEITRDRLNSIYNKLYKSAERTVKQHKPCNIQKDAKGSTICKGCTEHPDYNSTEQPKYGSEIPPNDLCCGGCEHHSEKGCQALKPLACKTWLCPTAAKQSPEAANRLSTIARRASRAGMYDVRGSKQQAMGWAANKWLKGDDDTPVDQFRRWAGRFSEPTSDQADPKMESDPSRRPTSLEPNQTLSPEFEEYKKALIMPSVLGPDLEIEDLRRLSEKQVYVLYLRFVRGLTLEQTTSKVGLGPNSKELIRQIQNKALRSILSAMEREHLLATAAMTVESLLDPEEFYKSFAATQFDGQPILDVYKYINSHHDPIEVCLKCDGTGVDPEFAQANDFRHHPCPDCDGDGETEHDHYRQVVHLWNKAGPKLDELKSQGVLLKQEAIDRLFAYMNDHIGQGDYGEVATLSHNAGKEIAAAVELLQQKGQQ